MRILSKIHDEFLSRIFCVVQNIKTNKRFYRYPSIRDNGNLTIGSIITIPNPLPVEDYLGNIPMIQSNDQAILCNNLAHFNVPF